MLKPKSPPPFAEFVALMAGMFALTALSIDAMLPALPLIAQDLIPGAPNNVQLVVTSFVAGLGVGILVMGPLSDSLGRRRVIAMGIGLYIIGAVLAWSAQSLPMLLAARVLQGFGIAAPRTAGIAMVRDLYAGRLMARVMSFVMTIFILVPAVAPFLGMLIADLAGWRAIFLGFVLCGLAMLLWLLARQPETLALERRRPFRILVIWAALKDILTNRLVLIYILTLSLAFGQMFGFLSSAQQIYDIRFGMAESFPLWFAVQALVGGLAGPLNAMLVMRLGMRHMATAGFIAQTLLTAGVALFWASGWMPEALAFPSFFLWSAMVFFLGGIIFGNLNALALEPLGHIAGMGAAVVGSLSTLLAVVVAVPMGLAFDGTPLPLMLGVMVCSALGVALMLLARRVTEA